MNSLQCEQTAICIYFSAVVDMFFNCFVHVNVMEKKKIETKSEKKLNMFSLIGR